MSPGDIAPGWAAGLHLALQALLVAGSLCLAYRFQQRLGPSPFHLAVGAIQFLHILFRRGDLGDGAGWLGRPEGGIFIAATLYAALLVYAKEGAVRARQFIAAIALTNVLVALIIPLIAGVSSAALDGAGAFSVFGSRLFGTSLFSALLLPVDAVLFVALYHVFSRVLPRSLLLRLTAAASLVLAHDALLYSVVRHLGQPDFLAHLLGLYADQIAGALLLGASTAALLRFLGEEALEGEITAAEGRDPADIVTRRGRYEGLGRGPTRDALTGLFNRGFFADVLPLEMTRCGRLGLPTSLLIADIDFFKSVNDRHGHPEGDRVLKAVAEALRATLRAGDAPCRIGGEEFGVVLPRASRDAGRQLATRIRRELSDRLFEVEPPLAAIPTLTIGIATYPDEVSTAEELIRLADERLYQGKHEGRDCIVDGRGILPATS